MWGDSDGWPSAESNQLSVRALESEGGRAGRKRTDVGFPSEVGANTWTSLETVDSNVNSH